MALPRLCFLGLAALLAATTFPLAQASAAQQWPEDGRGQGLFTSEWHEGRREALMENFLEKADDKDGVIILRGAGDQNDYRERHWDERERAWQQEKDRDAARAYRSQ